MGNATTENKNASTAATQLRALQAPLKEKYTQDPTSAFVTLTSSATLSPTNLTCSLSSSTASASKRIAGLHSAAGGPSGSDLSTPQLCSGDMLLESLAACFGVTLRAVSTSMGIALRDNAEGSESGGIVTVEGDLDFRGTLGVRGSHPASSLSSSSTSTNSNSTSTSTMTPSSSSSTSSNQPPARVPVGFLAIRLTVRLDLANEEADRRKVPKLIELAERYCVVLQTLRQGVDVKTSVAEAAVAQHDEEENQGRKAKRSDGKRDGEEGVANDEDDAGDEVTVMDDEVLRLN